MSYSYNIFHNVECQYILEMSIHVGHLFEPSPAGTEEKQEEPVNDIDEDVELRTTYSGIYLGQSMILHHFEEDLSIEYLDPMEIEDSQNNQTGFCYRNH